mmetsp:Transcript_32293/g.67351  ORF Transcript_32293/g.67351 Transcript_32293/m.67351 type:complete len:123 (-) Transcript_32293:873-1241(-)
MTATGRAQQWDSLLERKCGGWWTQSVLIFPVGAGVPGTSSAVRWTAGMGSSVSVTTKSPGELHTLKVPTERKLTETIRIQGGIDPNASVGGDLTHDSFMSCASHFIIIPACSQGTSNGLFRF